MAPEGEKGASEPQPDPIERAVELFVFLPVGLALSARDLLPKLVDRGRQQITGQVGMARVIGQFAVQQGQAEVNRRLRPPRPGPAAPRPQPAPAVAEEDEVAPGVATPNAATPEAVVTSLAIPDYDSLSASQVLPRLSGLAREELAAVSAYEEANRGRKTILNRVRQLEDG